ncbi:hypothetical protein HPK19_03375 [Arthrobacter citreus]|nr:hypothetical protein HPK19_03375 [Arthrobacter citreus]
MEIVNWLKDIYIQHGLLVKGFAIPILSGVIGLIFFLIKKKLTKNEEKSIQLNQKNNKNTFIQNGSNNQQAQIIINNSSEGK